MTTLDERLAQLPAERRGRIEERAEALIAEERSLRDLHKPPPRPRFARRSARR